MKIEKVDRKPISWAGEIPITLAPPKRRFGPRPKPVSARFWSKVKKTRSCWLWTGSNDRKGYGRININARGVVFANRVSWVMANGDLPENTCVLHRCDNPACVRPKHLFVGAMTDNHKDMRAKGRMFRKLTDAALADIRTGMSTRRHGFIARMARKHSVTKSAVWRVVHGKTWAKWS